MKIVSDEEEFDPLQATFGFIQMAHLASILRHNGIDEDATARICGEYFNVTGRFVDQGWMILHEPNLPNLNGRRFFPELAFSERTIDPDEGIGAIEVLYLPDYATMLEEYTSGNLDELASWDLGTDQSFECDPPIRIFVEE